jgi:hypothetical protein
MGLVTIGAVGAEPAAPAPVGGRIIMPTAGRIAAPLPAAPGAAAPAKPTPVAGAAGAERPATAPNKPELPAAALPATAPAALVVAAMLCAEAPALPRDSPAPELAGAQAKRLKQVT